MTPDQAREGADKVMDAGLGPYARRTWRNNETKRLARDRIAAYALSAYQRGIEDAAGAVEVYGATDIGMRCLGIEDIIEAIRALSASTEPETSP